MRLTFKLPAVVVGAIVATAVAGSLTSIAIGRHTLRQAAIEENVHDVRSYASTLSFYVEGARSLLAITAQMPLTNDLARRRELAGAVLVSSGVFEYFMLLTPEGAVALLEPRALEQRLSHRDLSFSAWFAQLARSGKTVVSDLHISPVTQRPSVVIATPVRAADGRITGVWAGALRLSALSGLGADAGARTATHGSGFVTDRRGLILAHQARPTYVEQQTDFTTVPSVRAALAGATGTGEFFNPIEGEWKFAAYRPLPDLGWAVVYSVPVAAAFAPVESLTIGIASASAALVALIGAGVYLLARRSVVPLAGLTAAARTIGLGDFSQRIAASSRDEVGELAVEFNRMAASLSAQDGELRQRAAELEAANRELESFSYSVSHDLRAPLRAMDGFSLALIQDYGDKLDAEGVDALQRVRAASQRMGRLIDDLLNLSRVTRAELTLTDMDFSAAAREIADALQQSQPGRKVRWEIAEGLRLRGDPGLIRIALHNLMANAWKFTGKTTEPAIRVGARANGGAPEYFVADNGAGFDMVHAGKLFGAFQRLHHADEFPGSGIGLAIVQRIVRRHGGEIRAEAAPGEGATFLFTVGNAEDVSHG